MGDENQLNELYSLLREADKLAQSGDKQAAIDAKAIYAEIEKIESSSQAEPATKEESSLDLTYAPPALAGAGATAGLISGPNIAKNIVEPVVQAGAKKVPGQGVRNYIAATTEMPFAGGKDYGTAYEKASIAAGKPIKSRGSEIPIRRGSLGLSTQPEPPPFLKSAGTNITSTPASAPSRAGSALRMGAAGSLAGKTAQDIQQGNYGDAALHGTGALASLAGQSRYKPLRILGNVVAGGEIASGVAPFFTKKPVEEKAMGGLVGYAAGKKVAQGGLEAAKKLLSPAGKSGAQVSREASYVHDVRPSHKFSDTNKLSIQDLQGSVLVGVPGDRSLTGHTLYSVNGVPLAKPTELFGGPRYGQRKADLGENSFWASQQGAASAFQNKVAKAAEETGMPVHGIYTAMAPDSSNYALHHTESLLNQLDALNPRKKDVQAFDKIIRSEHPAFFGLNDPDVMEQLRMNPEMRKLIAERLNKRSISEVLGLPSGEATTHAITEPRLRDVATGTSGFSVGKLDPHAKLSMDIAGDHPTYNTKIPGEFRGEMIAQLPWQDYFPDVAKQIASNPKQAPHAFGTFKMGQFYQPVNQELVDRIAPLEEILRKGVKKAEGGSTTPAWQRSEGKNPEGGLNAVGRASYNRETGGNLKAPQPEGGPRKKSFCARMEGMKKKNTSSATANDPDSRINKSLRKWKC